MLQFVVLLSDAFWPHMELLVRSGFRWFIRWVIGMTVELICIWSTWFHGDNKRESLKCLGSRNSRAETHWSLFFIGCPEEHWSHAACMASNLLWCSKGLKRFISCQVGAGSGGSWLLQPCRPWYDHWVTISWIIPCDCLDKNKLRKQLYIT